MTETPLRITPAQAHHAAGLLLERAGADQDIAAEVARNLTDAEMCGHASHGLRLAPLYVERLLSGAPAGHARPRLASSDGPIVKVDGEQAFGQVAGAFATRHGIAQARIHGIALVAVSNSGHFGRNGMWPEIAAAAGVASLHFINAPGAPSSVVPPGGKKARLTSDPVAFGLPRRNGEHVIVDFATGDFSVNAIKLAKERGERLPRAAILREDGTLSDDPVDFLDSAARAMLPFGGFKGFGLAVVTEILAGALTGGTCHSGDDKPTPANNMMSIHLDIERLTDPEAYERESEAFLRWLTRAETGGAPIDLIPGTRSRKAREMALLHGIPIDPALQRMLLATADRLAAREEISTDLAIDVTSWQDLQFR